LTHAKAKILVVDDDTNLLDLLVDTLTTIGYHAVAAPGGAEALMKLNEEKFDLMISDIKMPGIDGLALLKKVRRHYPQLPVLFITGVASPEIIGRASPDGFLAKPFRINHMEELIESTLNNRPDTVANQIKRVLVVDDDDSFREMLTDVLRYNEYVPFAVRDGASALVELENGRVDAVVTDIKMPGMDGIVLTNKIKEKHPDMPVILITAFMTPEDLQKHEVSRVADGFLEKPFKVERIIEILNNLSPIHTH
jgi:DNA-binding NtrC family response regulator